MIFSLVVVPSIWEFPSVHFPVLDEGDTRVFIGGPELPLRPNLQGQSGVKDELSKKFLLYEVLKESSEGSTNHCVVAPPFMKGTVVRRSRPFWVRWERSGRTLDPWLVLDSIENVIDGYSE